MAVQLCSSFSSKHVRHGKLFQNFCFRVRFIAALLYQRPATILPQTNQDKKEISCVFSAAYCCLCFWIAITTDFLPSHVSLSWPLCTVSRAVKRHTSSSYCPTARLLISLISSPGQGESGPECTPGPHSHLCCFSAPLKSAQVLVYSPSSCDKWASHPTPKRETTRC